MRVYVGLALFGPLTSLAIRRGILELILEHAMLGGELCPSLRLEGGALSGDLVELGFQRGQVDPVELRQWGVGVGPTTGRLRRAASASGARIAKTVDVPSCSRSRWWLPSRRW
jgi:hypothetical protein